MCVEYLYLSEGGVKENNVGSAFADDPISSEDIYGLSIKGIRVHPRLKHRITSEYC